MKVIHTTLESAVRDEGGPWYRRYGGVIGDFTCPVCGVVWRLGCEEQACGHYYGTKHLRGRDYVVYWVEER